MPATTAAAAMIATMMPPPARSLPFLALVPARTDFDTDRLDAGLAGAAIAGAAAIATAAAAASYFPRRLSNSL